MNTDLEARALDLLQDCLRLPAERRDRWLREVCDGNGALLSRVRSLLETSEQAGRDLRTGGGWHPEKLGESVGRLGPYRILSKIGEGGMSRVFRAVRDIDGVEQVVAIKLHHGTNHSKESLRRYDNERSVLSALTHPFIARFYDSGSTDDGRLYQVIEWIDGVPIDEYCDANSLDIEARLRLFIDTCSAVEAAHQSLVIHRDIKPSNILVTQHRTPKLIDFGISKQIEDAHETQFDYRAFTPAYASPEQLRGERLTTSTDVYSLGALLYKLAVNRLPYDFANMSRHEIGVTVSAAPIALPDSVAKDLAAIIRKAMHPEQIHRYRSVEELVADLRRYLAHRPVTARASNSRYVMTRFFQRNAAVSLSSLAVLIAIVVAFGISLRQIHQAEAQLVRAETTKQLMRDIFVASSPNNEASYQLSHNATIPEVLAEAERRLSSEHGLDWAVRVELLNSIAYSLMWMEQDDDAIRVQNVALSLVEANTKSDDPLFIATLGNAAEVFESAGEYNRALALFERAAFLIQARGGVVTKTDFSIVNNYGYTLANLNRWSESLAVLSPLEPLFDTYREEWSESEAVLQKNLGIALLELGRVDEARIKLESALRLTGNTYNKFYLTMSLAWLETVAEHPERAISLYEQVFEMEDLQFAYAEDDQTIAFLFSLRLRLEAGEIDGIWEKIAAIEDVASEQGQLEMPDAWPLYYAKSAYFYRLGDLPAAKANAQKALLLAQAYGASSSKLRAIEKDLVRATTFPGGSGV